jgi:hypothetical protein
MTEQHGQEHVLWSADRNYRRCPCCAQEVVKHGWLYADPPPPNPINDTRKPLGEVFQHPNGNDCVRLSSGKCRQ